MDIWNPRLDGFVPESGDSCFIVILEDFYNHFISKQF